MGSTVRSRDPKKSRVIAYVDGFNVYYGLKHACRDVDFTTLSNGWAAAHCIGRSLYWLDIQAVVLSQLLRSEECVAIKYFTATRRVPRLIEPKDRQPYIESNERQRVYLEALQTLPLVEIILGWYSENTPHQCPECNHRWPRFEEKMTDANIATHTRTDTRRALAGRPAP